MSGHVPDDEDDDIPDPVPFWRRRNFQIVAVVGVVGLAFLFTKGRTQRVVEQKKSGQEFIGAVVDYKPPVFPVAAAAASQPTPASAPTQTEAPPQPPQIPSFGPSMLSANKPVHTLLTFAVPPKPPEPPPAPPAPTGAAQTTGGASRTGIAFKAETIPGGKASPSIDDTYQLMPGLLPCTLDTAIQSDLPGPLMCHLPWPAYSPKGVVLMEAGTQITGTYVKMTTNGGSRLSAVAAVAHTPNGIWVALPDEPMSDDLGRAGLDGAVNNHYAQRFGGAIILSLTEGALGVLQSSMSKSGSSSVNISSGGGVGGLAEQILQSQVNIAPTFTKDQGDIIAIWITKPIDFSDSYRVRGR